MAEVLVEFDTTVRGDDAISWSPRACGRLCADGLWEGWIEFTPNDESLDPARTPRETEQPNRDDLMYWAQGLTQVYLEDALRRALEPPTPARLPRSAARPHFEGPAPRTRHRPGTTVSPLLNPFDVYLQGENILTRELSALSEGHVRNIAIAYGLLPAPAADALTRDELSATIVAGVRRQTTRGAASERDGRT